METLKQNEEQNATEQRHLSTLQESRKLETLANSVRALQTETNPEKVLALYRDIKADAATNPEVKSVFESIQKKLEQAILETLAPSMQIGRGIPAYDVNMLKLAVAVFKGMPEKYDGDKFAKAIQATSQRNKESLQKAEALIDSTRGTKLDIKDQLPFIDQVAFKRTNTGVEPTLIRRPYYEILDGYNLPTIENYKKALREAAQPSNLQLARSIGGGNHSAQGIRGIDFATRIDNMAKAKRASIIQDDKNAYIASLEQRLEEQAGATHTNATERLRAENIRECPTTNGICQIEGSISSKLPDQTKTQLGNLLEQYAGRNNMLEPYNIQSIQTSLGITSDGIAGSQTIAALIREVSTPDA